MKQKKYLTYIVGRISAMQPDRPHNGAVEQVGLLTDELVAQYVDLLEQSGPGHHIVQTWVQEYPAHADELLEHARCHELDSPGESADGCRGRGGTADRGDWTAGAGGAVCGS